MKKLLLLVVFILSAPALFSQWSTNPAVNNLVSATFGDQRNVSTCPDGAGGIIIVWQDDFTGSQKIYAQKISVFGQPVWTVGGIRVCPVIAGDQRVPVICTDAAGGAIIYWEDLRSPGFIDYYAQRIRTDGLLMWDAGGVKVNNLTTSGVFRLHKCISAEAGSSIFAWGNLDIRLYTQKLDAFGNRTWDVNDVLISTSWQDRFDLCYDGGKGAYYSWSEQIDFPWYDLFAQHVNALGNIQWSPRKTVCNEQRHQFNPVMCEDQAGGFIIGWMDLRSNFYTPLNTNWDLYAAHFNSAGNNLWAVNGIPMCTNIADQYATSCVSDLHGGAHFVWMDERTLPSWHSIYVQNIDFNGNIRWDFNGKLIQDKVDYTNTGDGNFNPKLACVDALGGAVVCWIGYRDIGLTQYGILAQKIDYYGNKQWDPNAVFVSTGGFKAGPSLIFDGGSGGCNIAWSDARGGTRDIYAQHLKSNSFLGNNKPKPVNVKTDILTQNFPNPFNPTTSISFSLVNDANISVRIFDMSGRELEVLADGLFMAGNHSVTWNANNYASGTYFYKFTNGNNVEVKKMFLVK